MPADDPIIEKDGTNYTKLTVWVDEDFACTNFKSCSKVSLIASASIQSAMSFLDFESVNGMNQSLTIMNFTFDDFRQNAPKKKRDYDSCSNFEAVQRRLEE